MWSFATGVVLGVWMPAGYVLAAIGVLGPVLILQLGMRAGSFRGLRDVPVPHWQRTCRSHLSCGYNRSAMLVSCCLLLGHLWGFLWLHQGLADWYPAHADGETHVLAGEVVGIPEVRPTGMGETVQVRFLLRPGVWLKDCGEHCPGKGLLRLAWWEPDARIQPGDRLLLELKLRRPRGLVNDGGFDSARRDLSRGIVARGSVVRLLADPVSTRNLHSFRLQLADAIRARIAAGRVASALLPALVVGDRSSLTPDQWQRLQETGLAHLVAISGLHITLVAMLAWWLFRWLLAPVALLTGNRGVWPVQQMALLPAIGVALGYAALAGFALPATRALLMASIVMLCSLARFRLSPFSVLGLTLLVVLLVWPLAVLDAGFWLSFIAVAVLYLLTAGKVTGLVRVQLVLSLGLGALAAWMFVSWGLLSPLLNLVMVPVFSFVIVPLALLGALVPGLDLLLFMAASGVDVCWDLLAWLAPGNLLLPPPDLLAAVFLLLAMLLLVRPLAGIPRVFALVLLLPWLFPASDPLQSGDYDLVFFDVGQGLAVIIRTTDGAVLYDTGPGWEGGDTGAAVIRPWLRRRRLPVSLAFISHGDLDHAGGLASLRDTLPPGRLFSGEPERVPDSLPCQRGQSWQLGGVSLRVLWPPADFPRTSNNASCVLLVESAAGKVLLSGDISRQVEYWLSERDAAGVTVLQVPHHGSKSSSSYTFLRAFPAQWAVASAGYANHFGHPADKIRARYANLEIPMLETATAGMIVFSLRASDNPRPQVWRDLLHYPWL